MRSLNISPKNQLKGHRKVVKAFDIQKWINNTEHRPYYYRQIAGQIILLQPLNHIEYHKAIEEKECFYLTMLQYGLLHPDSEKPYPLETITKFLKVCPDIAMEIAYNIHDITVEKLNNSDNNGNDSLKRKKL